MFVAAGEARLGSAFFRGNVAIDRHVLIHTVEHHDPPFAWGPQPATNPLGIPANFGARTPVGTWGGVTRDQYATNVPSGYARLILGDFALAVHAAERRRT